MIKNGDRVKFISDTTVGEVVSIKNGIANVLVEDGFEIPALITDLVAVDSVEEARAISRMGVGDGTPVNSPQGKKRPNTVKDPKAKPQKEVRYGKISLVDDYEDDEGIDLSHIRSNYVKAGILENENAVAKEQERINNMPSPVELTDYEIKLCFVPDNATKPEESGKYGLYLVNDSSYSVFYSISKWSEGNYVTAIASGEMEDDTKEELAVFGKSQLSAPLKLLVNLMFHKPTSYVPQPVEDFTIEVSPMKFVRSGNFVDNEYFDERIVLFTLASSNEDKEPVVAIDDKALAAAIRDKGDVKHAVPSKRNTEPEIIDLHADHVLDSTEGMSHGEIMRAQMARFEIAMDLAVNNNRRGKIVFIHGVGTGKLKYEMTKLLASKYPRVHYQDASFKEYGYGAIMVSF